MQESVWYFDGNNNNNNNNNRAYQSYIAPFAELQKHYRKVGLTE